MAITTLDQFMAALAGGQNLNFYKASIATKGAGTFRSLWGVTGYPSIGQTPSISGEAPTNLTDGAMYFTNAASGSNYIASLKSSQSTVGTLMVYDRLVHTAGLSGALLSQTVNSAPLTRHTSGFGVELWCEFYIATGASASTITVSYTNELGVSDRTSVAVPMPATPAIGQMIRIPLAAGDNGIRSVQAVSLSASTGAVGSFGFTLVKPIVNAPVLLANTGIMMDFAALGMPVVEDSACIAFAMLCSATNSGIVSGSLSIAQG